MVGEGGELHIGGVCRAYAGLRKCREDRTSVDGSCTIHVLAHSSSGHLLEARVYKTGNQHNWLLRLVRRRGAWRREGQWVGARFWEVMWERKQARRQCSEQNRIKQDTMSTREAGT